MIGLDHGGGREVRRDLRGYRGQRVGQAGGSQKRIQFEFDGPRRRLAHHALAGGIESGGAILRKARKAQPDLAGVLRVSGRGVRRDEHQLVEAHAAGSFERASGAEGADGQASQGVHGFDPLSLGVEADGDGASRRGARVGVEDGAVARCFANLHAGQARVSAVAVEGADLESIPLLEALAIQVPLQPIERVQRQRQRFPADLIVAHGDELAPQPAGIEPIPGARLPLLSPQAHQVPVRVLVDIRVGLEHGALVLPQDGDLAMVEDPIAAAALGGNAMDGHVGKPRRLTLDLDAVPVVGQKLAWGGEIPERRDHLFGG
jgi:hypothetical protein